MAKTMEFWFRRRYNLPPNDPRFLDLTPLEIQAEYWAHHAVDNNVADEIEDEQFDLDEVLKHAEESDVDEADWEEVKPDGE